jgi:hypothetical protein
MPPCAAPTVFRRNSLIIIGNSMVLVKGNFKLFSTFFVRFAVMCDVRRGAMEMGLLQN